jgi:hypothetical protein
VVGSGFVELALHQAMGRDSLDEQSVESNHETGGGEGDEELLPLVLAPDLLDVVIEG